MRPAAVALAWFCALWLLWVSVPRASVAPPRETAATPAPAATVAPSAPVRPARDLFAFVRKAPAFVVPPPAPSLAPQSLPSPSPTPEPIRVLGIVRQGTGLRAMLSLRGETALVAVGERFSGYEVVALDEETVRLRGGAGGAEITIELPLE